MKTKHIIIHLVGEQIRNQVLMEGLERLGFDCTAYTLNISETILTLVGFDDKPDTLYSQYFALLENAVTETTYLNMDEMISKWSNIIYNKLIEFKSGEIYLSG
ncbi:hypothetical protein SLH46_06290 [Draconibacterium sp. IB214405]|uniref:hypothetical protein n=1 Tax=Draconibacterium sp. IB214405 TaxID=3097352 RepID=UPI002A156561|nr:hypothetical protein [Draconibacterium sp. IB214405]MDX8338781.1 hypothetical protein [Draconibacterium sp. IB214405]